jgi:hypothetical protein
MNTQSNLRSRIIWLIIFSIAMGFLETAVVIYLRLLYYPDGFDFPLVVMSPAVGVVEILREAATVVMLLGVGVLAGANTRQRFAFFILSFAIWDLFYYIFLKIFLDWPSSFFTWDILFLIPAPWVGPVLSPVIICFTMIALTTIILSNEKQQSPKYLTWQHWSLLIAGSLVVITSWMWDYIAYSGRISDSPEKALEILASYVPEHFNWWMFGVGEGLIVLGIWLYYLRSKEGIKN